jgi:hypothetical protein
MQVEPVDDRFGGLAKRFQIAGEIGKPLVVPEQHVAMPSARPQAGLPFHAHVPSPALLEGGFDMLDEHIAAGPAVGSGLLLIAVTAGCTKNEGAHKAQREITIDGAVSPMGKNSRPVNHPLT